MCVLLKFLRPLRLFASSFFFFLASALLSHAQPKTPADELASFHLADTNLVVELVAAEPDVISPVAMCWDADGRMFVAEMSDYPMGPAGGKIKLLEDRDGDGRYERVTVFADKLNFPNGVLPWNGGVLVTAAPDILFLKDTDGDGRADERHVLLTGFGQGNQQLRVNGLTWGLDNWVYGANGRSDGEVHPVEVLAGSDWAKVGTALARTNSIRGHDFRFRPGTGEFEAIAGRSQFGQTRDDWGNRFLSWNTMPIRHEVIPERYLKRNPHLDTSECVADLLPPDDTGQIFPLTPPPLVFNNESASYFNALAGLTIFRGDALGEKYRGNAFMGEALRNLIHRRVLEPSGVTFIARRGETNAEFLASTDPWFHPVNFATAPDGALYFADFYRQFVEHPDYVHGEGIKEKIEWRTGAEHGRIWRIREKKTKLKTAPPNLSRMQSADLVKQFSNRNAWWRDTAQRLLVQQNDKSVVPALREMAKVSAYPIPKIHALWSLDGLGEIEKEILIVGLKSSDARIQEQALRLIEPFLKNDRESQRIVAEPLSGYRIFDLYGVPKPETAEALRSRLQSVLTLGMLDEELRLSVFETLISSWIPDPYELVGLLASVSDHPLPFYILADLNLKTHGHGAYRGVNLQRLREKMPSTTKDAHTNSVNAATTANARTSAAVFLHENLAKLVGASGSEIDQQKFLERIPSRLLRIEAGMTTFVVALARFSEGLAESNRSLKDVLRSVPTSMTYHVQQLTNSIRNFGLPMALHTASEAALAEDLRKQEKDKDYAGDVLHTQLAAVRLLSEFDTPYSGEMLHTVLRRNYPAPVQSAAVKAIIRIDDRKLFSDVFTNWNNYSRATQRIILTEGSRSTRVVGAFLDAVELKKIDLREIDAMVQRQLFKMQHPELKKRVEQLFKDPTATDRDRVVRDLQPALKLAGDARRGATLFSKTCVTCHAVQGKGKNVGPDLSGIGAHPKETLLADIFDPSRQVASDYVSQTIVTTSGETVSGIITTESGVRVTLRQAGGLDETFVRSQIKEITADGKSLMPDGLEQGLSHQDVADLLEFLAHPDAKLLPEL